MSRLLSEASAQRLVEGCGSCFGCRARPWSGSCPFHNDGSPSLVVTSGSEPLRRTLLGRLWHGCRAGVLAARDPRTDARVLLGADGDLELLAGVVEGDLGQLTSVHIEPMTSTGEAGSYDVDQDRCSGQVVADGMTYVFVTTAAEGETTRLLKVVTLKDGVRNTLRLSEFDSAGPVAPEPSQGVGV